MPLEELLSMDSLKGDSLKGKNETTINAFYGQAAVFVDFLTEEYPKEKLVDLINKSIGNPNPEEILKEVYGFESMQELVKNFEKYRRKFE